MPPHKTLNFKIPSKGFTLIELLIVITIMMTALSLVGPQLFGVFDKSKVRSERLALSDSLQKIAYKAFINDRSIQVKLSGNSISYFYQDKKAVVSSIVYEHIAFPEQEIVFSNFGFADIQEIKIKINTQIQTLSIKS